MRFQDLYDAVTEPYRGDLMPSPGMYDQTAAKANVPSPGMYDQTTAKANGLPNDVRAPQLHELTMADRVSEAYHRIESLENLVSLLAQRIDAHDAELEIVYKQLGL